MATGSISLKLVIVTLPSLEILLCKILKIGFLVYVINFHKPGALVVIWNGLTVVCEATGRRIEEEPLVGFSLAPLMFVRWKLGGGCSTSYDHMALNRLLLCDFRACFSWIRLPSTLECEKNYLLRWWKTILKRLRVFNNDVWASRWQRLTASSFILK